MVMGGSHGRWTIFSLFTFINEQKAFDNLPIYVSDNQDNVPSVRLFDGDLNVLISLMHNMLMLCINEINTFRFE